jgi:hypothetical protein
MKKLILIAITFWAIYANGQTIYISLSGGTGKTYIFESNDKSVNTNYSVPLSLMTEVKFTPKEKNWGLKLRLHNIESSVTGENWETETPINGYINSLTTSILLENEIAKKNYSYGLNFGMGITKETVQYQQDSDNKTSTSFTSLYLGGHLSYNISKNFDLQVQPILLWQDPFKTIGVLSGKRTANFAGEDLSTLINFGIKYKLSSK